MTIDKRAMERWARDAIALNGDEFVGVRFFSVAIYPDGRSGFVDGDDKMEARFRVGRVTASVWVDTAVADETIVQHEIDSGSDDAHLEVAKIAIAKGPSS